MSTGCLPAAGALRVPARSSSDHGDGARAPRGPHRRRVAPGCRTPAMMASPMNLSSMPPSLLDAVDHEREVLVEQADGALRAQLFR